jgi:hypothetical protein
MVASRLNQTLSLATTKNLIPISTSTTTPISAPFPVSTNQSPQWDAVAVYGFVFGLLAVLLAVPGTYLAIIALKRHREHDARQSTWHTVFEEGMNADHF